MSHEIKPFLKNKLGSLPDNWEYKKIKEFIQDFRGGASLAPKDFVDSGILVLPKLGVVRGGILSIDKDKSQYCSKAFADKNLNSLVDNRFLIIVLRDLVPSGPNIGLIVRIPTNGVYVLAQGVYGLLVNSKKIDSDYLIQLTNGEWYRRYVNRIMVGTTQVHLRSSEFQEMYIPLPPLPEQKKIAEILGKWDEGIEKLGQLIQAKRTLKKGLMQQLLTGKKRFKEFKGEKWKKQEFGRLVDLCKKKYNPKNNKQSQKCVELEHIKPEDGLLLGFSDSSYQACVKSIFEKGDVLFGKLRPYLKKFWLASFNGVCSSEIWVLRAQKDVCHESFVFYLIQSHDFFEAANVTSGTKMPRSDWGYVSEIPFNLPSLKEQQKTASVLTAADNEIDLLEKQLEALKQQKKGLMQKLLTGKVRVKVN